MTSTMTEIRSLVRRQLLYYLENDLKGGEELMKEVWEQCETDNHVVAAKHELEEIIEFLRDRDRDPRLKRGAGEVPLDAASLRDAFRFSSMDAANAGVSGLAVSSMVTLPASSPRTSSARLESCCAHRRPSRTKRSRLQSA